MHMVPHCMQYFYARHSCSRDRVCIQDTLCRVRAWPNARAEQMYLAYKSRLLLNDVLAKQWHSHPQIHINI